MIYIQTNEEYEVVFFHKDPLHPVYGIPKTEEELKAEGFLIDYLNDIPRPEQKEGFRSVTYSDGEKFWFKYVELEETLEEKYLKELALIKEEQEKQKTKQASEAQKAENIRIQVEVSKANLETVAGDAAQAKELADFSLNDGAMMMMELLKKEEQLMKQNAEIQKQKESLVVMGQSLEKEKLKIESGNQQVQETIDFLNMTTEESAMMTMMLMDMDFTITKTKEKLLVTVEKVTNAEKEVTSMLEELHRTKEEVATGTNESASLTMMMMEIEMSLNNKDTAIKLLKTDVEAIKKDTASFKVDIQALKEFKTEFSAFKDAITTSNKMILENHDILKKEFLENKSGIEVIRRGFLTYEQQKNAMLADIALVKKEKTAFEQQISEKVLQQSSELVTTKQELVETKAQLKTLQDGLTVLKKRLDEGGIA